ncbi:hypothetical protein S101446_02046 [Komagataeibacter europaeus]|nr:hypothetical protein S101446_02046 [Komagataeibacter europaeus]
MSGKARTIAIQHCLHEQTVVRSRAADMPVPTGENIFNPFLLTVT